MMDARYAEDISAGTLERSSGFDFRDGKETTGCDPGNHQARTMTAKLGNQRYHRRSHIRSRKATLSKWTRRAHSNDQCLGFHAKGDVAQFFDGVASESTQSLLLHEEWALKVGHSGSAFFNC